MMEKKKFEHWKDEVCERTKKQQRTKSNQKLFPVNNSSRIKKVVPIHIGFETSGLLLKFQDWWNSLKK